MTPTLNVRPQHDKDYYYKYILAIITPPLSLAAVLNAFAGPFQSWIAFQLDTEPNQHGKSGVELVLTLVLTREVLGVHRSLGVHYGPKNRIYYTPVPNAHERS